MLAFLDPKSRTVYAFSIVGMAMALVASQVNSFLLLLADYDYLLTTTNLTPVSEEILKALPVLFFTFVMAEKREEITPVAFSVGVGFAILENVTIFLQSSEALNVTWALYRCLGAGLMHGICTASVGTGMAFVKYRKKLFLPGTVSLLSFAILYHSIFNALVQTEAYKYYGILLPILTYIPLLLFFSRNFKKKSLI